MFICLYSVTLCDVCWHDDAWPDFRDSQIPMIPTDETHENIWAIRNIRLLIGYVEKLYCLISGVL